MKASDYTASFKQEGCTINALSRVIFDMMLESKGLVKPARLAEMKVFIRFSMR